MKQVLDIKQMQHLQELGLELGETLLYWARETNTQPRAANHYGKWVLVKGKGQASVGMTRWEYVPAYTLQEVLDALPSTVLHDRQIYELDINMCNESIEYMKTSINDVLVGLRFTQISLIDAAYSMLCWCIENRYVKTENENMQ